MGIKLYKLISLIILITLIFLIIQHLRKESIIKEINSKIDIKKYNIPNNIMRLVSNTHVSPNSEKIPSSYKLVYEMNFDCSHCLIDLKEIYNFYIKLSSIREIKFCLITSIKSYDYIKFYLDQLLKNYDIWIGYREIPNNNIKLYLLDDSNNIIMAGDIIKYPFLKDKYIKKLKKVMSEAVKIR